MERRSTRTSLSLFLSTALHASAIALIALGPTYIPGLGDKNDRNSSTIEFSVDETGAEMSSAPMQAELPAQEVQPTPTPVVQPIAKSAPVATPVAASKAAPAPVAIVEKPKKKRIAKPKGLVTAKLPEKVEPQSVVAYDETSDVPVEQESLVPTEKSPVLEEEKIVEQDIQEEIIPPLVQVQPAQEVQPVQENPVVAAVPETLPETLPEAVPAEAVVATEPEAPTTQTPEPVITTTPVATAATAAVTTGPVAAANPDADTSTPNSGGKNAGGVGAPVEVTQSYLGLRQSPGNKPPAYTREMRLKRLQGRGQLVYFVAKDGSVSQIKMTQSTGSAPLDQAALDAFKKYKFVPGQEGYTVHDFEFSLKGPAESDGARLRTTMNK